MEMAGKTGNCKVKKVRISARDIHENCMRIKAKMDSTPVGTEEYSRLQKELENELTNLKKYKDGKFMIHPKDCIMIGGTVLSFLFLIGLSREWPSSIKLGSLILKMFPYKGI